MAKQDEIWISTARAAFLATGASRETSPEIMEAIAYFARDSREAESLWHGDGLGQICQPIDLWEYVTKNGLHDVESFHWGAAGAQWWQAIQGKID